MASQDIPPKVEEAIPRSPINNPHPIIPNFVAPDRTDKIWEFGPTSMQPGRKRTMVFGAKCDNGTLYDRSLHRSEEVCISAGLGCIITKDALDRLPKYIYQVYPHPSFTISIALADGRLQRINTCKDVVVVTLFLDLPVAEAQPDPADAGTEADGGTNADTHLGPRPQTVEIHRTAVVVPTVTRLCPDMNVKVWMGADDIARDGSKRPLFRDSFDSDGQSLLVISHDGGSKTVI